MDHQKRQKAILEMIEEAFPRYRGTQFKKEAAALANRLAQRAQELEDTPPRKKLPQERRAITHHFEINGHDGYITAGLYPDGRPGEIFITMAKQGSTVAGLTDAFAICFSMALQHGIPLEKLVRKFSNSRFEPSGFTKNAELPNAKSVIDYIVRWLGLKFLGHEAPGDDPTPIDLSL